MEHRYIAILTRIMGVISECHILVVTKKFRNYRVR